MSIYGKRVDGWFRRRSDGTAGPGITLLWQVALVVLVAVVGIWLMTLSNGNL